MATPTPNSDLAALAAMLAGVSAPEPASPVRPPDGGPDYLTARIGEEVRAAARELARRRVSALALYEPLAEQEKFHASRTRQRLLRGSNRSGKTLSGAVELARAVTGDDPHRKYPERDGRAFVVGLDLMHVSQVFYRKLFRPGAFRMIRDEYTNQWRAYRPWLEADRVRKPEAKPAPPLIPPRLIESVAWEEKAKGIPRMVKLKTGWEITFFSSQAKPPQGMDLDIAWLDEELDDEEWHPELSARLLDRKGVLFWSATPQAGNEQLLALSERADRDARLAPAERAVEEFVILLDENPHIDAAEKAVLASLLDEDQLGVRVGGEFAAQRWRVFPEFQSSVHVRAVPDVPPHWTRYAAVDPGRQVCAVLFAAVPPPEERQPFEVLLYDELYIRNCSAAVFGERMAEKAQGQEFELFLIDNRMGRQTQIGSGETVEFSYAKALKANRVRARRSGHGFAWGADNVKGGIETCRSYLRVDPRTECPRVVVRADTCPNFRDEIKRYRYKRQGRTVTDEPETRGAVHQMANLRYVLGCHPRYVAPRPSEREGAAYRRFREKERRRRERAGETSIRLGPGG